MNKYLKEYKWSHIGAMLKNNKITPKKCSADLKDRFVVITGATSGIGYHTARKYASHGAKLLCINRNEEKSKKLQEEIINEFNVECNYYIADFSSMADIHATANMLKDLKNDIDILIHNAGVFLTKRTFTKDNIEQVFQVNYLSSFIINFEIKEKLKAQDQARIILVNSEGHRFAIAGLKLDDLDWKKQHYTGLKSYGSAKTAQLLSMLKFKDYFAESGVSINAMHPGDVKTNMGENNGKIYKFFKHNLINPSAKSPLLSAESLYYLGASQDLDGISGKFFNFTTEERPAPHALDLEMVDTLWIKSLELANLS